MNITDIMLLSSVNHIIEAFVYWINDKPNCAWASATYATQALSTWHREVQSRVIHELAWSRIASNRLDRLSR